MKPKTGRLEGGKDERISDSQKIFKRLSSTWKKVRFQRLPSPRIATKKEILDSTSCRNSSHRRRGEGGGGGRVFGARPWFPCVDGEEQRGEAIGPFKKGERFTCKRNGACEGGDQLGLTSNWTLMEESTFRKAHLLLKTGKCSRPEKRRRVD